MSGRTLTLLMSAAVGLCLCVLGLAIALPIAGCDGGHQSGRDEDEGLLLCRRFARLKQAHDPGAGDLLGPAQSAPREPITSEEAERIDADTFLRRDELQVLSVRPAPSARDAGRFVLVTKGAAVGEPLRVRSGDRIDRVQRVVTNPVLVVEVVGGKIHGLRVELALD